MMTIRDLLKLAGFGVVYATCYNGLSFAKGKPTPIFALRGEGFVAVIDTENDEVLT